MDVQIPVNTTAVIQLPEKEAEFQIGIRLVLVMISAGNAGRPADSVCIVHDHIRSACAGCTGKADVSGSH